MSALAVNSFLCERIRELPSVLGFRFHQRRTRTLELQSDLSAGTSIREVRAQSPRAQPGTSRSVRCNATDLCPGGGRRAVGTNKAAGRATKSLGARPASVCPAGHGPDAQAHRPCLRHARRRAVFVQKKGSHRRRPDRLPNEWSPCRKYEGRRRCEGSTHSADDQRSQRRAARSTAHRRCQAHWSGARSRRPPVHGRGVVS